MTRSTCKIRALNDQLRSTLSSEFGRVNITVRVNNLSVLMKARISAVVMSFDKFDEENDPHSEHDFGAIEIEGETYFFKIDYYDKTFMFGSEDPSDPEKTARVMTIMHASDY